MQALHKRLATCMHPEEPMSNSPAAWQTYPDVRSAISLLQASVEAALGAELLGFYLCGSLASGDFDPRTSDIDFLGVTRGPLVPDSLATLAEAHRLLYAGRNAWLQELEGSYIPTRDIRRHVPGALHPRLERGSGELRTVPHDSDWVIHRHILREQSVALSGPPPAELIDPVTPDELREAVRGILFDWWEPMELADPQRLRHLGYRYYAVQTMCRMLYTLKHGTIVSKPAAARWALAELDPRWHPLIEESLAWPRVERAQGLPEALDLVTFTVGFARGRRN
jgi:hypothetical protein